MKNIKKTLKKSRYINSLSPACKMCSEGAKMVVLITGLCPSSCYYCPLSFEKKGKDRIFADEWELKNEEKTDILIKEAELIDAKGAGITGGDPLLVSDRTKNYIKILKEYFGLNFHIHLYTSGLKNIENIDGFVDAGLDEIRFHPEPKFWNKIKNSPVSKAILQTLEYDIDLAIEIPAIPNMQDDIFSLIKWAEENNLCWVNLNELEFSETNQKKLSGMSFVAQNNYSSNVKNSEKCALDVINKCSELDFDIGVHYCSCSFKDAVQLRNRIRRRARNIVKNHEIISDDGTLLFGVVTKKGLSVEEIEKILLNNYSIDSEFVYINKGLNRVETGVWILDDLIDKLKIDGFICYIVEEYPTFDRLEVERIPLPL